MQIKELSNQNLVHNDTDLILERHHIEALNLGLSYVPNTSNNPTRMFDDTERLRRLINLRLHWQLHKGTAPLRSVASEIIPSAWQPPETIRKEEEPWHSFLSNCLSLRATTGRPNFPHRLKTAWKELINNPEFYLMKADKGGKTVMWKRSDYEKESLRQLSDPETYLELTEDQAKSIFAKTKRLADQLTIELRNQGCISPAEATRLIEKTPKMPGIYFLPKIHKDKRPDTLTFAGRPIQAAINGPLKQLDEYIARITSPLLKFIPGSIIDTRDLLRQLYALGNLPSNSILFSADVEALYPSIDWTEGRKAATEFYSRHYHKLLTEAKNRGHLPPPKPKLFCKILQSILENNIFHFRDTKWFKQVKGTAMGCSISVYLANTFMFTRTKELIRNSPKDLLYLGRYIDDIVGIWTGREEDIVPIFSSVVDQNIKLTFVVGRKELEALDLKIIIEDEGKIKTRLFRKPTDGHQFIHWSSNHPVHTKKGVVFSQFLRAKVNCSDSQDCEEESEQLTSRFEGRGYPKSVILAERAKVSNLNRETLLFSERDVRPKQERLAFVTSYDGATAKHVRRHLDDLWKDLVEIPKITERKQYVDGEVLPNMRPRLAYRGGQSLGSQLGPIFKRGKRENQTEGRGENFGIHEAAMANGHTGRS